MSIMSREESKVTDSEVKKRPNHARTRLPGLSNGPWFYPTLTLRVPGSGPGYRVRPAEDTGTRRTDVLRPSCCPGTIEALSPEHRRGALHRGSVGVRRVLGVPRTVRYGPNGPP